MRTRMALIAATTGAALAATAGAAAAPPGSQYPWAQPWGAAPAPVHAQPWPWIPIAEGPGFVPPTVSAYHWAQPGSWSEPTAHAYPPASVLR